MRARLPISEHAQNHFLGTRYQGRPLREELEAALARHEEVSLNFSGLDVTQSFIDEMIGVLVLKNGPRILGKLVFEGCSEDVQSVITFVVNSRVSDYLRAHQH